MLLEKAERITWYSVQINNYSYVERGKEKNSSSYRDFKLFLSEDWFEVVMIDCSIASIPLFRIDIPPSSESICFGAKITRTEPDNKVELREILGPPYLPPGQYLGSGKVLKIFMIYNNIDGIGWTL